MSVVTRIARSRAAQESLGFLGASYLKLVRGTNRFSLDPPDAYDWLTPLRPFIIAMWHGQHLMVPFVRRPQDRAATMVSRSVDGGVNTAVLERMGVRVMRGSGARRASDMWAKGGVSALRGCLKAWRTANRSPSAPTCRRCRGAAARASCCWRASPAAPSCRPPW